MTYIIGLKQPGINAIISDARVSWQKSGIWQGQNTALKTGVLFPGCVYGRMGNVEHSRKFIRYFKSSIDGVTDTLPGFWQRLKDFIDTYPYPTEANSKFQLLLSSRASGEPKFHHLDSLRGLTFDEIEHENYIIGFGSGSEILSPYVTNTFTPRLQALQRYLLHESKTPKEIIRRITPYFLCLWLSELALTHELSVMEEHQVGGVFHFVYQTGELESPQGPAIYVFCDANLRDRVIYGWCHRVVYAQGGLYVERHIPAKQDARFPEGNVIRDAFFDDAARPDVADIPKDTLRDSIKQELATLPFYQFCGFGFAIPSHRRSFGFLASNNGKREDIFDKDGRLQHHLQRLIVSNYER